MSLGNRGQNLSIWAVRWTKKWKMELRRRQGHGNHMRRVIAVLMTATRRSIMHVGARSVRHKSEEMAHRMKTERRRCIGSSVLLSDGSKIGLEVCNGGMVNGQPTWEGEL